MRNSGGGRRHQRDPRQRETLLSVISSPPTERKEAQRNKAYANLVWCFVVFELIVLWNWKFEM